MNFEGRVVVVTGAAGGLEELRAILPVGSGGALYRIAMALPRIYLRLRPVLRKAGLRAMAARRGNGGAADILAASNEETGGFK